MTSRERVLQALAHQPTDRVPRLLYEEVIGYTPPIKELLQQHCAPWIPRDYFQMDITRVLYNPTRLPLSRFADQLEPESGDALAKGDVDEWGVWRRKGGFHHFVEIRPTLGSADLQELTDYPWPDLGEPYRWEGVAAKVAALHQAGYAVTGYAGSIFERSWYLRGMEELLIDMVAKPGFANELLERAASLQRTVASQFAKAGVDVVITGDDIAGQQGMLMSVSMWREFLKPRLAATIQAVKAANPETYVFYHSDGNLEAAIPELIEIGIDILNPIQPECMDPTKLKRLYGDRLSFWGTLSVQRTMSSGSSDDVRNEVFDRVRDVAHNGGLILSPAHVLSPETPWENIVAFFEAADSMATKAAN